MLNLRELTTFIGIEINVIDPQGSISQRGSGSRVGLSSSSGTRVFKETRRNWLERDVEFHFVVLKGDQGQCKTGISATKYFFISEKN